MDPNDIVTVVNRTSKTCQGTHDGRPYDLPPGESKHPLYKAYYFRYQNPVMGRGTPLEDWNSKAEYLIGIKELGDDCTPMEQSNAPQRWDTAAVNGPNTQVIRPRGGGFIPERLPSGHSGGIVDSGFTKP